MTACLDGVRVLELARFQAGPRGGMLLSDLGAEVIKVEPLGGEETRRHPPVVRGQSVYFSVYNRGKKSICLDLRSAKGKEVFAALVAKADIVLENFRPGVMAAMGFAYEQLCALNPGIILVSVSGFGQYGPYRDRPAFDSLGQAMGGLMSLTGQTEGHPVGTASSVVDRYTALHATIGTLAALRQNTTTDYAAMGAAMTGIMVPNFVLAPLLTLVFGLWLSWLPVGGWDGSVKYMILPVFALSLYQVGFIARLTRGSMIEVLRTNYVRTARAKGLPERVAITRHALKAGMLPVVSYLGPAIINTITGSVIIEQIFGIPGIGRYFVQAALNRDYTLVMGVTVFYGVLIILANLAVDLIYGLLDPRIRYD